MRDLTDGSITKSLIALTIPIVLANIITAIIALSLFMKGKWEDKQLTEEIKVETATAEL